MLRASKAFFSHQFGDNRIKDAIETINAMGVSLGIQFTNVSNASADTPIDQAKRLITESEFLIALCTRDQRHGSTASQISSAVLQEITLAYSLKKPIICLCERDLDPGGFLGNMCTYEKIDITGGPNIAFAALVVKHLTQASTASQGPQFLPAHELKTYYLSRVKMTLKLIEGQRGFFWEYIIEKNCEFTGELKEPILTGAWSPLHHEGGFGSNTLADFEVEDDNGHHKLKVEHQNVGKHGVEGRVFIEPAPKKGLSLKLRERYRSASFNPVHSNGNQSPALFVDSVGRSTFDGALITNRIDNLELSISFPRRYKIENSTYFVSTWSGTPGTVIKPEVDRLRRENAVANETFDGATELKMHVSRPHYSYFYGFCWNPPARDINQKTAIATAVTWDD